MVEKSGILFAYLGEGAPPAFPHFDCFVAPDAYTFAFKGYWDCNWLQALEVGIDPAHASWLHKYFEDEDTGGELRQAVPRHAGGLGRCRSARCCASTTAPRSASSAPTYGMRLQTLRRISDAQTHIRVTNILFPQAFVIPMNAEMTITQCHVPVDDTGCYWYSIFTSFGAPVDKDTMREQRLKTYPAPDYKPIHSQSTTAWGFNAEEQKLKTFTGMGFDINIHDQFACESPGVIADRTQGEPRHHRQGHRALPAAAARCDPQERGGRARRWPPNWSGPPAIDGIGPTAGIDEYWKECRRRTRRSKAAWAA